MNTLVTKAIETRKNSRKELIENSHNRAKIRIKECFGEYAVSNLIETLKPCHFRIKDTNWNLVYGFLDGFTIWHKDYPEDDDYDSIESKTKHPHYGKFNAWQILDMKSLGESLVSVSKTWGLT